MIGWPDGLQVKPRMVGRCKPITSNILFFWSLLTNQHALNRIFSKSGLFDKDFSSNRWFQTIPDLCWRISSFAPYLLGFCSMSPLLCFLLGSLPLAIFTRAPTVQLFRFDVFFRPWSKKRKRKRSQTEICFIRGGSGKRHKFFLDVGWSTGQEVWDLAY